MKPPFFYALFFLILCTILLTLPGSAFPTENWLDRIWFDKWVHIGMFALLVVVWCWTVSVHRKRNLERAFTLVAFLFLNYGIAIEFIQQNWVNNRSFDRGDIIADAVGCAVGYFFSSWRYIKK